MEECNEDCLGYISTYVPKPDWPALALVSRRWHMMMARVPLLSTVVQCEQACYDGDFLAVTRAARVEPVYFRRGTERAGRGGHYQLGQWLITHDLGSSDSVCFGACRDNQTKLIDILWPILPKDMTVLALKQACRGGHLQLVKRLFSELKSPFRRPFLKPILIYVFQLRLRAETSN